MKTQQLLLTFAVSVLPLFVAVEGFNPHQAVAQSDDLIGCRNVVGTYLTIITDANGNFASRSLITLTSDGNVIVSDSNQGGIAGVFNPFTITQGTWTCVSRNTIKAIGLNFSLTGTSTPGSIARTDYSATFTPRTGTVTGSTDLRFFGLNANPLTTNAPSAGTFTFTGVRVSK